MKSLKNYILEANKEIYYLIDFNNISKNRNEFDFDIDKIIK